VNVFAGDWDDAYPQVDGWRSNYKRLGVGKLGLGLYELFPGQTQCPYHFHHGNDEALVVLAGHPTLRAPTASTGLSPVLWRSSRQVPAARIRSSIAPTSPPAT
jgi:hypothetical protein